MDSISKLIAASANEYSQACAVREKALLRDLQKAFLAEGLTAAKHSGMDSIVGRLNQYYAFLVQAKAISFKEHVGVTTRKPKSAPATRPELQQALVALRRLADQKRIVEGAEEAVIGPDDHDGALRAYHEAEGLAELERDLVVRGHESALIGASHAEMIALEPALRTLLLDYWMSFFLN